LKASLTPILLYDLPSELDKAEIFTMVPHSTDEETEALQGGDLSRVTQGPASHLQGLVFEAFLDWSAEAVALGGICLGPHPSLLGLGLLLSPASPSWIIPDKVPESACKPVKASVIY
jgi:hypothetical protein